MFLRYLDIEIESATDLLVTWQAKIVEIRLPEAAIKLVYEMEWSQKKLDEMGVLRVYIEARKALTDEGTKATMESLLKYALEQTVNGARYGARSTSPISNLMEASVLAAWATLAKDLRGFCEALAKADAHYGPPTAEPKVVGPSGDWTPDPDCVCPAPPCFCKK